MPFPPFKNPKKPEPLQWLLANVLTVRSLAYLKKAMGWDQDPVFDTDGLQVYQYLEDLNDRRLRDAEVIGAACCNARPKILVEIGTSHGRTTALMAENAPSGTVYTLNIPPEEIPQGGQRVTCALSREEIGSYYRARGVPNVRQLLANSKDWEPDFGPIDVAFIDGCHDENFVYSDTRKILKQCRPGSIVMWHDFNPDLARVYHWIDSVCRGVDRLYAEGVLKGRILHLQDSWVGLYRVPGN